MRRDELLEIMQDWNFWRDGLDCGRERREYLEKVLRYLDVNVIVAIIGIRRSGKSYIMRQVIKKLIEKEDRKNILMVNFEDRRFVELYPGLLDEIYETYLEVLEPEGVPYVLLDEVHNVPGWERWVRTMHELGKAKVIVSGSSSKLLSGDLATVLTGRHLDVFVFPLGFREFLDFKGVKIRDRLELVSRKTEIKRALAEYAEFGGFPEVVLSREKKQLLLTYFDDILTKDIERRYNLKRGDKLRALAKFYLTNISRTITFNSLRKTLGTTTNTIEKFSSYLEEVNMVFFVKRFSFKVKEQEKAARKVYCTDVGLANAVGFRFSSNLGRIAENMVAVELKRRETLDPNMEFYYWQDARKKEVDFVIKDGLKVRQLIQVCYDVEDFGTKERELRALLKASRELRCDDLLVITWDYEDDEEVSWRGTERKVRFVPLWKWLLED